MYNDLYGQSNPKTRKPANTFGNPKPNWMTRPPQRGLAGGPPRGGAAEQQAQNNAQNQMYGGTNGAMQKLPLKYASIPASTPGPTKLPYKSADDNDKTNYLQLLGGQAPGLSDPLSLYGAPVPKQTALDDALNYTMGSEPAKRADKRFFDDMARYPAQPQGDYLPPRAQPPEDLSVAQPGSGGPPIPQRNIAGKALQQQVRDSLSPFSVDGLYRRPDYQGPSQSPLPSDVQAAEKLRDQWRTESFGELMDRVPSMPADADVRAAEKRQLDANGPSASRYTNYLNKQADGMSAANDRADGVLSGKIKDNTPYGARNVVSPYGQQDIANWNSMPKAPTEDDLRAELKSDTDRMRAMEERNNAAMKGRESNAIADPEQMRNDMATTTRDFYNYRKGGGKLGMKDWSQAQAYEGKLSDDVKAQLANNYKMKFDPDQGRKFAEIAGETTPNTGRRAETARDKQIADSHARRVGQAQELGDAQAQVVAAMRHGASPQQAWAYQNAKRQAERQSDDFRQFYSDESDKNRSAAIAIAGGKNALSPMDQMEQALQAHQMMSGFDEKTTYENAYAQHPGKTAAERHKLASEAVAQSQAQRDAILKANPTMAMYVKPSTAPDWSQGNPNEPIDSTIDPTVATEMTPAPATQEETQAAYDSIKAELFKQGINREPTKEEMENGLKKHNKLMPPIPTGHDEYYWRQQGEEGRRRYKAIYGVDLPPLPPQKPINPQHGRVAG